ncbi:MAG: bacteriohemerythrin [Proteobacteria bacterium]|nr:bacteriohemerythrin [Pseudomonadota bacterium]
MSILDWNKSLEIGHTTIDEQHKGLVKLLNDLHSAMSLGVSSADYTPIRMRLYEYTVFHFSEEEALMGRTGYKLRAEHEREHFEFVEKLNELAQKASARNEDIGTEIFNWLADWLLRHISQTDRKLVECLKQERHDGATYL